MTDIHVLSEDQRDCLQELFNVAMGQAGDALARKLRRFVRLSIPRISLLNSSELKALFVSKAGSRPVSAVRHRVSGLVPGESLVVFFDASVENLSTELSAEGVSVDELALGGELAELLGQVCLQGFAAELALPLTLGEGASLGHRVSAQSLLGTEEAGWQRALVLDINYQLECCDFNCDLFFLIPDEAVTTLLARVDQILSGG